MLLIHSAIDRAYCLAVMLHRGRPPEKRKSPDLLGEALR